jgi:hypothetical protein
VVLLALTAFLIAAIDIAISMAGLSSLGWSPLVFMLIGVLLFTFDILKQLLAALPNHD